MNHYSTNRNVFWTSKSFSVSQQASFSELEVKRLFDFMEEETSGIEEGLKRMEESSNEYTIAAAVTINKKAGDYDNISIFNEVTTAEDEAKEHKSAFGVLCNVKQRVLELKDILETNCAKLDYLARKGRHVLNSDDVEELVTVKTQKRHEFEGRLKECLKDIGNQMDEIRRKNDITIDGVRHLRYHPDSIPGDKSGVRWLPWIHGILFMVLIGVLLGMYKWSNSSDQWIMFIRLVRSPLLIVLVLYLYGINLSVWIRYKIDYISIFDHHPNGIPTPTYVFNVAGILTIIFTLLTVCFTIASPFFVVLPIKIIPVIMWLILAAFIFNPSRILLRKARFNFILTFGNILLAPFVFVSFSDFFLADQLNSLVAVFLDIQYLVCYLVSGSWSGDDVDKMVCTSSSNGIRPIISFLPALWRLLQCLRCYYDTHSVKHLVNAGKYFTVFPVIVMATIYATIESSTVEDHLGINKILWVIICWAVVSLVHAIYTSLWDFSFDWGLWDIKNCGLFQRRLLYRHKVIYLVAIVLDLVLRFLWTLKLSLAIIWDTHTDLIYTVLVVGGVLRRFMWNFFRVEYAYVLSCSR